MLASGCCVEDRQTDCVIATNELYTRVGLLLTLCTVLVDQQLTATAAAIAPGRTSDQECDLAHEETKIISTENQNGLEATTFCL